MDSARSDSHRYVARHAATRFLAQRRATVQALIDCVAWAAGLVGAMLVRFDFSSHVWSSWRLGSAIVLCAVLQLVVGSVFGLYVGRWRFGSFDEVAGLNRSVVGAAGLFSVINLFVLPDRMVPLSVNVAAGFGALIVMAGARYLWRRFIEHRSRPDQTTAKRVVVFGGGEGGVSLINSMMRNPQSDYLPVAILDDDPAKRQLRINSIPVLGDRSNLAAVVARTRADLVVVAIPTASSALLRELSALALAAQVPLRVVPPVNDLLSREPMVADIRPLREVDLLGRQRIETDLNSIAGYLNGRTVLVTGAGGSIGSELCRQLSRFGPRQLVMLDRDESALHQVQLSIEGRALLDTRNLVVADIRDRARLEAVFEEHRPEVVFHAAALKHLPLLEMHPGEAVKTNITGTLNVLDASRKWNVVRFVNISTDKAADPVSVLGYSKRVAERLTAGIAETCSGTYLSVRFGNVLGSRGSMLGAFEAQAAAGGPITVTHPEVTRYFMTIAEAVQLVIQAGAVGADGEALVLDMGEPVRIVDVAHRLVAQSERPIEVVFTGLRPGEKLHETLFGAGETDRRPAHPLISHVAVPPLPRGIVDGLDVQSDERLRVELRRIAHHDLHAVARAPEVDRERDSVAT